MLNFPRHAKRAFVEGINIKSKCSKPASRVPLEAILGCSLAIVNYDGPGAGKHKDTTELRWPDTKPHAVDPDEMFWPSLLLYRDKKTTQGHNVIFRPDQRPQDPKKVAEGEPEDDPFDRCNTGTLQVSAADRGALLEAGMWAVCAYPACDRVPTAWPLRLAVANKVCMTCNAHVDGPGSLHLVGRRHAVARNIMSHLDDLMGPPVFGPRARVYVQGAVLPDGVYNFEKIAEYWGVDLLNFPRHARRSFKEGVNIKSKRSKPSSRVPPEAILGCSLAIVN